MMLSSVQTLRFVAALLVLLLHVGLSRYGFKGVDLFFVISGFVLYYTYHSRPAITRKLKWRYLTHRLTKIFLLYWTALILLYPIHPYPINLSFLGTLFLIPGHKTVLVISWSLSYELYFYTILGITLFYIPARWHRFLFVAAFFFTAGIKLVNVFLYDLNGTPLYFLAGPNLWEFLLGILAGALYCRSLPATQMTSSRQGIVSREGADLPPAGQARGGGVPWLAIFFVWLILFCFLPLGKTWYYHFTYGPIAFLTILAGVLAEKKEPWNAIIKECADRLGNASYAIYLFSPILIRVGTLAVAGRVGVMLALIVVACLVNRFYEEPLLKAVRNVLESNRGSSKSESRPNGRPSSN